MKCWYRIISIIIALICVTVLVSGCDNGSDNDNVDNENNSNTEEVKTVVTLDLSAVPEISVVRPETTTSAIIENMQKISGEIKSLTSAKISLKDDWYRQESEIDRYEIIIGNAKRPEVAESYQSIRANDYIIRFSDQKLWILGGSDEATVKAAEEFHKLVESLDTLKFEAAGGILAQFTDTYEINESLLAGQPFRNYKLLYSSDKYQQTGAVSAFLAEVQSKTGYVLQTGGIGSKADSKILLKMNYDDGTPVSLLEYEVKNEGPAITVYGGSNKAFRQGLKKLFEGFSNGELKDADSKISVKGKYSYFSDDRYPVLEGLRMYAMGDSYFAGSGIDRSQVWMNLVALKYQMDFINYGIGGSTISNFTTDHNPMVDRIPGMKSTAPDIVLFEGGRNDYSMVTPLGGKDSRDSKTFQGAIRLGIEELHKKYPNALVICVTNWNFPGTHGIADSKGYAKAFAEVANSFDFAVCINATNLNKIPVDMTDAGFRKNYCVEENDISHLNADGMRYVEPYFEEQIAYYYSAFIEGRLAEVK